MGKGRGKEGRAGKERWKSSVRSRRTEQFDDNDDGIESTFPMDMHDPHEGTAHVKTVCIQQCIVISNYLPGEGAVVHHP